MRKRIFLKIELSPAEDALLKKKYDRGIAKLIAKHVLLDLEIELPRNTAVVQSRRERTAHIARCGNNLNQISKVLNQAALDGRISEEIAVHLQAILIDILKEIRSQAPAHAHKTL